MPTPNAIGVRIPTSGDSPNGPIDIGNAVSDLSPKTVPPFNTTTERDAASSIAFKMCTVGDTLQQKVGSGWVTLPRGLVGQSSGPPVQLDRSSTFLNIIGISVSLIGGRTYEFTASIRGTQVTANGIPTAYFAQATDGTSEVVSAARLIDGTEARNTGAFVSGMSTALITPGSSGTVTLYVVVRTTAGAVRFAPNSCYIWVKDIGAA